MRRETVFAIKKAVYLSHRYRRLESRKSLILLITLIISYGCVNETDI